MIKGNHPTNIWKNKVFLTILVIESVLLLIGIAGLFQPIKSMAVENGQENITLKSGVYNVRIDYAATQEVNTLNVEDALSGNQKVLFGTVNLAAGVHTENYQLWVLRSTDSIKVNTINGGDDDFRVNNLKISSTNLGSRIFIFMAIIVFCIINGLFLLVHYSKYHGFLSEQKLVWSILTVSLILVSIPCMVDYNIWSDDLGFHLLRVEGLLSGLRDGQFPVRIQGNWLSGYGYAVSVFLSDFFMLIPLFFRWIGFTVNTSYRMFLFVINAATIFTAYQCLKRCFKNIYAGCVVAVLYTLSTYRIHAIYGRASVGEALAMIFLPVVFYGCYQIFSYDRTDKNNKYHWLVLSIGLSGILHSHVLSFVMVTFSILLLCFILIKRVLQKQIYFELIKTAVTVLLLNLWYLIPFIDYVFNGKFSVSYLDTAQKKGIFPTHLLFLYYGGGVSMGMDTGMYGTGAFSIGAALLVVLFIWIYLVFIGDMKKSNYIFKNLGTLLFGYICLFFVLVSCYFPWNAIQNMGSVMKTVIGNQQFPYSFLTIACLCASVLAGVILLYFKNLGKTSLYKGLICLLIGTGIFFSCYQINTLLTSRGITRLSHKQSIGTTNIGKGEYLPNQTDITLMQPGRVLAGEGVLVEQFEKGNDTLNITIFVTNRGEESFVELPILYYIGYDAVDTVTGEHFTITSGENGVAHVILPAGYEGEIHIWFHEPIYWRIAEIISLLTFGGIMVSIFWQRRREVLI